MLPDRPVAGLYYVSVALVGAWLSHATGAVSHAEAAETTVTMLSLSEADNGRTVDLRVGQEVRITLPENATTGYRWEIDEYDAECIEVVSTEPEYKSKSIGSGGEVEFTFRAKVAGGGEIALKHWRRFQGDSSITGRFRVKVRARK